MPAQSGGAKKIPGRATFIRFPRFPRILSDANRTSPTDEKIPRRHCSYFFPLPKERKGRVRTRSVVLWRWSEMVLEEFSVIETKERLEDLKFPTVSRPAARPVSEPHRRRRGARTVDAEQNAFHAAGHMV